MKLIFRYAWVMVALMFFPNAKWALAAEAYRMEIESAYFRFEDDDQVKEKAYGLEVEQYFLPVNTKGHPLAEAAFLERIGFFSVFVLSSEIDFVESFGTLQVDRLTYGAFARLRKPQQPLFLDLLYTASDAQFDTFLIGDRKNKAYAIALGRYLDVGHVVALEYARDETDSTFVFLPTATFERARYALKTKLVKKLGGGKALNLEGEARIDQFQNPTEDGKNTVFELGGDYYFNRSVSLGGSVSTNSGDRKSNEGEELSARLLAYLHPSFSVGFLFEKFLADNTSGFDSEFYLLTVALRL